MLLIPSLAYQRYLPVPPLPECFPSCLLEMSVLNVFTCSFSCACISLALLQIAKLLLQYCWTCSTVGDQIKFNTVDVSKEGLSQPFNTIPPEVRASPTDFDRSFLGVLLNFSCFGGRNPRHQEMMRGYFANITKRTRADVEGTMAMLRGRLNLIQFGAGKIAGNMLMHPFTRCAIVDWYATLVQRNKTRGHMHGAAPTCSSEDI